MEAREVLISPLAHEPMVNYFTNANSLVTRVDGATYSKPEPKLPTGRHSKQTLYNLWDLHIQKDIALISPWPLAVNNCGPFRCEFADLEPKAKTSQTQV